MTDLQVQFLVALVGGTAWIAAALIDGLRAPVRAGAMLVVALGQLATSAMLLAGAFPVTPDLRITATMAAITTNAFVAALGCTYAIRSGVRVWESRPRPGRREP